MTKKDLNLILKEGEGYNIEYKQQVDKSLPKELVAFSNSSGEEISFPRNPLLFDLFYRADFIEKVGSGITRIKNACKNRNIRVKFDTRDFFRVTFYRKKAAPKKKNLRQKLSQVCPKSVPTDMAIMVLNIVLSPTSIAGLMEVVGQTNRTRFRNETLRPLIKAGFIKMTLSDKPKSSKQEYVITNKGKKMVESGRKGKS